MQTSESTPKPKPSSQKKSKRKLVILIIVLLIIAFAAFRIITSARDNTADVIDETAHVRVTKAAISSIEITSPLTGRIEPVDEVSVIPKAAGEVTNVYVALGDKVAKGALLFTLDGTQMQSALSQANAGYQQANAASAQANAGYEQATAGYNNAVSARQNAQESFDRIAALFKEGAVSQQQYDQAKYQLDAAVEAVNQANAAINQAKAGINQAKAGVSQAKAGVTAAADGASNTRITAPISGYITSVNVVAGGIASQAVSAVSIADIDTVEINCAVGENLINKIKAGDKVGVIVKSVADTPFEGTITALSPAPAVGSLTYPIKVSINNADIQIKPGMFAEVVVASEKVSGILTIPSDAVIIKGGKSVVATIADEKTLFKEVVTGLNDGSLVEIKSGITEQDVIVLEGQHYLKDDDPVNIIE